MTTARGDMFHWKPEGTALLADAVKKALEASLSLTPPARPHNQD